MQYYFNNLIHNQKTGKFSTDILFKMNVPTGSTFSCREYCNRHVQKTPFNFLYCLSNSERELYPKELNANIAFVTELLQKFTGSDKIFSGNRFFYCTEPMTLRSPLGSLITGVLKVLTYGKPIVVDNYTDFVNQLTINALQISDLGDQATRRTVALCIQLFNYVPEKMPKDPASTTYGTYSYLYNLRYDSVLRGLVKELKPTLTKIATEVNSNFYGDFE